MREIVAIVESSVDAIVGKTLDGIVTSWNKGAERLFGYRAEEIIGQPIARIIPEDRLEEEMQNLAAAPTVAPRISLACNLRVTVRQRALSVTRRIGRRVGIPVLARRGTLRAGG